VGDLLIKNVRVMHPGQGIVGDRLRISAGKISADDSPVEHTETIDGGGRLLTPGLMDLHTHGIHTYLYEHSPEQLVCCTEVLPKYGTTAVLPTLYTVMNRKSLKHLEALAVALDSVEHVSVPGFHMEGPFLALAGAGAETVPGDVGLLKEVLAAARGRVSALSVSPDTPNILPVIEYLCGCGIVPFITHTAATAGQTLAAFEAGVRHATHFYDVFPAPPVTEPGVRPVGAVEAVLADPRCTADFICDGVHVDPLAIRSTVAAKGYRGVILITDSNIGAGLPAGRFDTPWGFPVRTPGDGPARIDDPGSPKHGLLAGSSLTMNQGISNLRRWLDLPDEQVWAMGTLNPARLLGLDTKGDLRTGADADLVLWDEQPDGSLEANRTWVGGNCVYSLEY
jgi:N-acetylglucosamine-6-phosphate deacetylase